MSDNLTIHMIGNAHLDPVWQWRCPAGIDEAIATCRSACDFLDEYPELFITRGEAWVHWWVNEIDPALFARIRRHVSDGRWRIVNGWWIQPDCNIPLAESFRKHGEIGKGYFKREFGVDVTIGYNVDSFGHGAYIPAFLREAGMDSYVFMRPGEHEKSLQSDLFEWRAPSGESVTAFRISAAYCCNDQTPEELERNLKATIERADREIGHAMCFYGVGDHGGGPTRKQIEWIKANRFYADDVELVFSHPEAFFQDVAAKSPKLPVIEGELQYHAIGCYSAENNLKRAERAAEHSAIFAENASEMFAEFAEESDAPTLERIWRTVLFNQFHDILGGCSIKPACDDALDELGMAKSLAREMITRLTRRSLVRLPKSRAPRLAAVNLSDRDFRGLLKYEPWPTAKGKVLLGGNGERIPIQKVDVEALVDDREAFLFKTEIPAKTTKVFEIVDGEPEPTTQSPFEIESASFANDSVAVKLNDDGIDISLTDAPANFAADVRAVVMEDDSDTWSHGIHTYEGTEIGRFSAPSPWHYLEKGPLRTTAIHSTALGDSKILWRVSVDADSSIARLRLRVDWRERFKILKLEIPTNLDSVRRIDGVPGGILERPKDRREYPINGFLALKSESVALAVVSQDIFAADVQPNGTIRLTLLRSPLYLHHEPRTEPECHDYPTTDQGAHEFEILLIPSESLDLALIADKAAELANPIVLAENTKGMYGL